MTGYFYCSVRVKKTPTTLSVLLLGAAQQNFLQAIPETSF